MAEHKVPEISKTLLDRIRLVRRDVGNLLFHFTRAPEEKFVSVRFRHGGTLSMPGSASAVLRKILYEGKLLGTSNWTYGENCVCFTEAPIQELNSIFSLVEIASSQQERPRYEPYGIAVSKKWLFKNGGRPVIYDHPDVFSQFPQRLKYRFVPYNPEQGTDFTWEREWRIKIDFLELDPKETLVIVPTSEEAFEIVYEFAKPEADWDVEGSSGEGYIAGVYHKPKWLAVSLDLFGFNYRK
ncbi:MAG: hypothetical protein WBB37_05010 [bacterium]